MQNNSQNKLSYKRIKFCSILMSYLHSRDKKNSIYNQVRHLLINTSNYSGNLYNYVYTSMRNSFYYYVMKGPETVWNEELEKELIGLVNDFIWYKLERISVFFDKCYCIYRERPCMMKNNYIKYVLKNKCSDDTYKPYKNRYPEQAFTAWLMGGKQGFIIQNIKCRTIRRIYITYKGYVYRPYISFISEEIYSLFNEVIKTKKYKRQINNCDSYEDVIKLIYSTANNKEYLSGYSNKNTNETFQESPHGITTYFDEVINNKLKEKNRIIPKYFRQFGDKEFTHNLIETIELLIDHNTPLSSLLELWGLKYEQYYLLDRFASLKHQSTLRKNIEQQILLING